MKSIVFRIFMFSLLFFVGCNEEKEEKGNVIDKDKFIDILVDVHIADAILSTDVRKVDLELYEPENFYFNVLAKHGVSKEDFTKSINYYAKEPKDLEKMYVIVQDKISRMQAQLQAEKTNNKPKQDSINHHNAEVKDTL